MSRLNLGMCCIFPQVLSAPTVAIFRGMNNEMTNTIIYIYIKSKKKNMFKRENAAYVYV